MQLVYVINLHFFFHHIQELEERVGSKKGKLQELKPQLEAIIDEINEATWHMGEAKKYHRKQEVVKVLQELFPGVSDRLRKMCQPIHTR